VISLSQERDELVIEVSDKGKGISLEKRQQLTGGGQGTVGFIGMRERLRQFGGSLKVQSTDAGTVVTAMLKVA
jgi:signal transduction histidine kinase